MLVQAKNSQQLQNIQQVASTLGWNGTDKKALQYELNKVPSKVTITLVGNARVGKTSLIRRFKQEKFSPQYKPTFGTVKTQIVKSLYGDAATEVSFNFLETNDVFIDPSTVIPGKVDAVHASLSSFVLIVYDITNHETFEAAKDWVLLVKAMVLNDVTMILVGNKSDQEQRRQVHRTAGQVFATLNGMVFVETSAKNGQNLERLLNYVTDV